MASVSRGLTFNIPVMNYEVKIPLSDQQRAAMESKVREVVHSDSAQFDQMHATILHVAPVALAILTAMVLAPIWISAATLTSYVIGPISWMLAGVGACGLWMLSNKVVDSFKRQCPEITDYAAARLVLMEKETRVHTVRAQS